MCRWCAYILLSSFYFLFIAICLLIFQYFIYVLKKLLLIFVKMIMYLKLTTTEWWHLTCGTLLIVDLWNVSTKAPEIWVAFWPHQCRSDPFYAKFFYIWGQLNYYEMCKFWFKLGIIVLQIRSECPFHLICILGFLNLGDTGLCQHLGDLAGHQVDLNRSHYSICLAAGQLQKPTRAVFH